tara:strand:+ start:1639 stop:1878 length:240 start_codon:yes stop_codon:yes gene_type:complete
MSTGLSSYGNIQEIGPLYPGVGLEWLMVIVLFALWILWHLFQISAEEKEYREALKLYEQVGMKRAMHHSTGEVARQDEV